MKQHSMLVFLMAVMSKASAQTPIDSIDTFQHKIVDEQVTVQGREVLISSDVTVTSTGHLKMIAPKGVVINAPFKVALGGTLEVGGGRQYFIRYVYDASGNRISRKKESSINK